MKLKRYFYIGDDLDDLEKLEEELEAAGVVTPQIHVLTLDDSGAENHHNLHQVTALMKKDIVHSALIGAAIGACTFVLVLLVAYLAGWTDTPAGWLPFVFLAVVLLGFFTWEGGLRGIESPNVHFERFQKVLEEGKHVFFVDLEPGQEVILSKALRNHPSLQSAGVGRAAPHWVVFWQHRMHRFFTQTFP